MQTCPTCLNVLCDDAVVCDICGAELVRAKKNSDKSEHFPPVSKHSKRPGSFNFKISKLPFQIIKQNYKLICASVGILLVFMLIICLIIPSGSANYFVYLKDDQVYMSKVSNISPKQATKDFGIRSHEAGLGQYCRLSDNGKRLFFFDGGSNNLYYRSSKLNDQPTFITSNISIYDINDSANLITYIKDGDKLYQHNLKKQLDIIDSSVTAFLSSPDGKNILYTKYDNNTRNLYLYKYGKEPECLVPMFDNLYYISDDFDEIYFTKKGYFFKQETGEKAEKIASNIHNIIHVFENGEVYFIVKDPESNKDNLYFFDGKNAEKIFEGISNFEISFTDNPALTFTSAENGETKYHIAVEHSIIDIDPAIYGSVLLDQSGKDIYYISNIDSKDHTGDLYSASLSKKGIKNEELIETDVFDFKLYDNGNYLYVKNYNTVGSYGEIFANGKKVGDDLSWSNITYIEEKESYLFFKNIDGNFGDMIYFDNGKVKEIATDVLLTNYQITPKGEVLYLAQYSEVYNVGELFLFNGSKSKNVDLFVSQIAHVYSEEKFDEFLKNSMTLC